MVVVGIPAEEVGVVATLQDELLAPEVRVLEAHPGSALRADGVHPVPEALLLEVVAVSKDLQLLPCEVLALIEGDLERPGWRAQGQGLLCSVLEVDAWGPTPVIEPHLPGH